MLWWCLHISFTGEPLKWDLLSHISPGDVQIFGSLWEALADRVLRGLCVSPGLRLEIQMLWEGGGLETAWNTLSCRERQLAPYRSP